MAPTLLKSSPRASRTALLLDRRLGCQLLCRASVYADAEIVVTPEVLSRLDGRVKALASDLRIQFTSDPRCRDFIQRAEERDVLGLRVRVACLEDVVRGKLWAYSDPERRLSKRKKDELDLIRLAEVYPELRALYPRVAGAARA